MGGIVMIHARTERVAELLHELLKFTDMLTELTDANLDIFGLLFDLQAPQSLHDRLQVRHEARWTNNNDMLISKCIFNQVTATTPLTNVIYQQIIIKRFARDKHKSKIHCFLIWSNILGCSIDPTL